MQIKLTLIIISLFLALSSIGTVSASLAPQVILEDTPEVTIIPDETINTLIDTESNPTTETSESLTDNTLIVKTSTIDPTKQLEASITDKTEQTETSTNHSDLSEINISENKNPHETIAAVTEPITTSSVTESVNTVPENTKPINEPEIPSAALASGIVMVIGGIILPKN